MAAEQTLSSRTALITGASRDGIGRAIARRLAAHGARVVLHASGNTTAGLEETRDLIERAGGQAACVEADLGDGPARADLVARASAFFGPIDILVNNAAHIAVALASRIDLPARQTTFEVNFQAPVDLIQQALPAMRAQRRGCILNLTSDSVRPPTFPLTQHPKLIHGLAIYGASKAALERYTTGIAAELQGTGVNVNALKPAAVAWTAAADPLVQQVLATRPETVEPLEMLAEAALLLVTRASTGLVLSSRETLQMYQAKLHALDGEAVLGDATTLFATRP